MHVRPIEFGSADYHAARELRRRFLREPLGLELTAADVAGEESQHHFGLFVSDGDPGDDAAERLVGAAIGKPDPDDADAVRIRQVVIREGWRGSGRGLLLMHGVHEGLAAAAFSRAVLFAREEAAGFYRRCGYAETGETVELIGLPHRRMERVIG